MRAVNKPSGTEPTALCGDKIDVTYPKLQPGTRPTRSQRSLESLALVSSCSPCSRTPRWWCQEVVALTIDHPTQQPAAHTGLSAPAQRFPFQRFSTNPLPAQTPPGLTRPLPASGPHKRDLGEAGMEGSGRAVSSRGYRGVRRRQGPGRAAMLAAALPASPGGGA